MYRGSTTAEDDCGRTPPLDYRIRFLTNCLVVIDLNYCRRSGYIERKSKNSMSGCIEEVTLYKEKDERRCVSV